MYIGISKTDGRASKEGFNEAVTELRFRFRPIDTRLVFSFIFHMQRYRVHQLWPTAMCIQRGTCSLPPSPRSFRCLHKYEQVGTSPRRGLRQQEPEQHASASKPSVQGVESGDDSQQGGDVRTRLRGRETSGSRNKLLAHLSDVVVLDDELWNESHQHCLYHDSLAEDGDDNGDDDAIHGEDEEGKGEQEHEEHGRAEHQRGVTGSVQDGDGCKATPDTHRYPSDSDPALRRGCYCRIQMRSGVMMVSGFSNEPRRQ